MATPTAAADWFMLFSTDPRRAAIYTMYETLESATGHLTPGLFVSIGAEALTDMTQNSPGRWCGLLIDRSTLGEHRSRVDDFIKQNPQAVLLLDNQGSTGQVPPPFEAVELPQLVSDWTAALRPHLGHA